MVQKIIGKTGMVTREIIKMYIFSPSGWHPQLLCSQPGVGVLRQFLPFRYFPNFSASPKYVLAIVYHVHLWRGSAAVTPVKYECNANNLTGTLTGLKILLTEKLTNGALVTPIPDLVWFMLLTFTWFWIFPIEERDLTMYYSTSRLHDSYITYRNKHSRDKPIIDKDAFLLGCGWCCASGWLLSSWEKISCKL